MITFKLFNITPAETLKLLKKVDFDIFTLGIKFYEGFMETKLEIEEQEGENFINQIADITALLSPHLYATSDISIYAQTANYIKIRNCRLSVLEQLSGGRLVSALLAEGGMDELISENYVMTTAEQWIKHFDILPSEVKQTNFISSKNAYDLATEIITKTIADVYVVTIGVTNEHKDHITKSIQPYGQSYIVIGDNNSIDVKKFTFSGTRSEIMEAAAKTACYLLIKKLK